MKKLYSFYDGENLMHLRNKITEKINITKDEMLLKENQNKDVNLSCSIVKNKNKIKFISQDSY